MRTNEYYIYDQQFDSVIAYIALAESIDQVKELAEENGYDIEGCEIEEIRSNVKDQLGRSYAPQIDKEF